MKKLHNDSHSYTCGTFSYSKLDDVVLLLHVNRREKVQVFRCTGLKFAKVRGLYYVLCLYVIVSWYSKSIVGRKGNT